MAREKQKSYGIIGLGRFGATLAQTLAEMGEDVLVIDSSEAKIREARAYTDAAFVTDSLDKEALLQMGVQNCDIVAVCIGERIDVCILTTLTVIQLGVDRVIAKAISAEQGAVLEKLGAEVVFPESDMAVRLARRLTKARVVDYLPLGSGVEVAELRLTGHFAGQTVAQSNLRGKYGLNIIAIDSAGGMSTDIAPDRVLQAGDAIVVIGRCEKVAAFEVLLGKNT